MTMKKRRARSVFPDVQATSSPLARINTPPTGKTVPTGAMPMGVSKMSPLRRRLANRSVSTTRCLFPVTATTGMSRPVLGGAMKMGVSSLTVHLAVPAMANRLRLAMRTAMPRSRRAIWDAIL